MNPSASDVGIYSVCEGSCGSAEGIWDGAKRARVQIPCHAGQKVAALAPDSSGRVENTVRKGIFPKGLVNSAKNVAAPFWGLYTTFWGPYTAFWGRYTAFLRADTAWRGLDTAFSGRYMAFWERYMTWRGRDTVFSGRDTTFWGRYMAFSGPVMAFWPPSTVSGPGIVAAAAALSLS